MHGLASVVLSTFNQPRLLDLALHGYALQTSRAFERVIADDGSRPDTLWHRARVLHLFHPPYRERGLWKGGDAYYQRPDLPVEAPDGLRELARALDEAARLTGT